MSSKFTASIEAILDTSLVEKQIKDIGSSRIVLSNIQFDKQNLISSIESALNSHKFAIQVGSINTQSIKSQMEQSGSAAGKAFSQSFGSSLNNINVKNAASSIADLQRTLKGFGFNRSSIDQVTQELESMSLAVKNIKTSISGDSIRVTVNGIDEVGRAVSVVREFNAETGSAQRTSETISQSFDQTAKAAQRFSDTVQQAQTALDNGAIEASIEKMAASYEKLGNTGHERLGVIKTDIEELRQLHTEMGQATSQEQLVAAYEKFNDVLDRTKNNLTVVSSVSKQYASANEITALQNKMEAWLNDNSKAASRFGSELQNLIGKTQAMSKNGKALRSDYDAVAESFRQTTLAAQSMGLTGKTFMSSLKDTFNTVSKFIGSYRLIYAAINAVKKGVKDVISLDTALVDLRKTTDATASELERFYYSANDTAKALGTTTQEVIQAAAEWSRLGYSIKDAQTMAEVSSIFASISPGMDIERATSGLVSAMKAFNIEASDALDGIASKINIIGNTQAVTNEDIVDFLTRSSSAMKEANNTLDQTIALGTAAVEITRDASSVGNLLKTISMRLRGYDEETEQFIGNVEILDGDIAKLTKTAAHPGGISLFKDANKTEYKSTYEILRDISEIYDELTDKQQANLLEKIAGKRGAQVAAAIINNFGTVESSLVSMTNATGNAMSEMSIIQDSIEFKLNRLKETGVGFFQNLIKSDSVKVIVDTLTGVLTVIDKITGALGLLGTALVGISIAAFVKNFTQLQIAGLTGATSIELVAGATRSMSLEDVKATLVKSGLNKEQIKEILANRGVSESELEVTAGRILDTRATVTQTAATGTATTATYSLSAALKGLWATLMANPFVLIAAAIAAAVVGLNALCQSTRKASEAADEARDKAKEVAAASKEEVKQLDELIEKYKELAQSDSQDSTTREQIKNLQYDIVNLVGSQASHLDLVNGKLDEEYQKLLAIKKLKLEEAADDALYAYNTSKESSDKAAGSVSGFLLAGSVVYNGKISDQEREILNTRGYYTPPAYTGSFQGYKRNSGLEMVYGANDRSVIIGDDDVSGGALGKLEALKELIDDIKNNEKNWASSELYQGLYKQYKLYKEYVDGVSQATQELLSAVVDEAFYDNLDYINIDSLDAYNQYRDNLIAKVSSDDRIKEAFSNGDVSDSDVSSAVDNWLSSVPALDEYYKQYQKKQEEAKKRSAIVQKLRGNGMNWSDVTKLFADMSLSGIDLDVAYNLVSSNDFSSIDEFKKALQSELDNQLYFNYDDALKNYQSAMANSLANGQAIPNEAYDRLYAAMQHTYTNQLSALWDSEGFADTRKELVALANTVDGITPDAIVELAEKSDDLNAILQQDGMSAAFLANILQVESLGGDGFALITEDALKLNTALEGITRRFGEVTQARAQYEKATSAKEKDDDFRSFVEAFEELNKQFEAGTVNSNAFWAAAEYLFGAEQLEAWGWSEGIEQIRQAMQDTTPVFKDAESAGAGFLDKLNKIAKNGKVLGEDGSVIAEIEKFADGSYDFNIDGLHLDELAKQMGMSKEAVLACLEALSMWGNVDYYSIGEVLDTIKEIGLSADSFNGTAVNVSALTDQLITLGYTNKEIYDLLTTLQSVDGVTLLDVNSDVSTLTEGLVQLGLATNDGINIEINTEDLGNLMQQLGFTKDEAGNLITKLSEADNIKLTDSKGEVEDLDGALAHLDTLEFRTVTSEIDSIAQSAGDATTIVQNLQTSINSLTGKTVVVTVDVQRKGSLLGMLFGYASGTSNAHGGAALTGELGEELVLSNGRAYFVGTNGPEIVKLNPGDTVYTAEETKRIKRNSGIISGSIPAYSGGKPGGSGGHINPGGGSGGGGNSGGGNSGSQSNSSSNNSSNSDTPKELDWIEVLLNRIERAINRVRKVAESAYKSLRSKLSATGDLISKINQEIAVQQSAYNRYMQQANSVGLSASLAEKVRNGTIDITKYSSATQDLIKSYQEWYEKALACSDAIQDLHEELAKLYTDKFNAIKDDFDNQLSMFEHMSNMYNSSIDMLEARGYMASVIYYQRLRDAEQQNLTTLQAELSRLQQAFNEAMNSGEIEEYSDAWYQMVQAIHEVEEAITQSNVQLVEFNNTIRDIEWGYFDYMQDRISQLTDEASFLIDLLQNSDLYDDSGNFTDSGWATAGLHGQNYNVYMAQADDYAQQILELNELIANDPNNTALIERREELLALQRQAILAAEDEKQALIDLVRNGIEIQLGAIRDLINSYKDALDSAKDLHDYQKKIAQQTANIASIEKQLAAYSNDNSDEARAIIQRLQLQLQNAQDELAETEYEHYISDQKKLLDDLYSEYEEMLNQRLDNVDALMQEMIGSINERADIINQTLLDVTEGVGYTISDSMQAIWDGSIEAVNGVLSMYGDAFSEHLTVIQGVLAAIRNAVQSMIGDSDDIADPSHGSGDGSGASPTNPTPPSSPSNPDNGQNGDFTVGSMFNAANAPIYGYPGDTTPAHQYYDDDPVYVVTKQQNGYVQGRWHRLSGGATGWFRKSDITAYKTGGLVDYTGLAQVDGTRNKPELMLNADDTRNFLNLRDYLKRISDNNIKLNSLPYNVTPPRISYLNNIGHLPASGTPDVAQNNNISFGDIHIDHVEDYNDFVTQLRNDPKFEKMITAMTLGKLAGNSSLSKYNYTWQK